MNYYRGFPGISWQNRELPISRLIVAFRVYWERKDCERPFHDWIWRENIRFLTDQRQRCYQESVTECYPPSEKIPPNTSWHPLIAWSSKNPVIASRLLSSYEMIPTFQGWNCVLFLFNHTCAIFLDCTNLLSLHFSRAPGNWLFLIRIKSFIFVIERRKRANLYW